MDEERPSAVLRRLVNGYQVSQALHVAAMLGIADRLAGGPRASDDVAAEVGAHAGSLYRVLRALAAVGVLHEDDDRRFALTEVGECLRSDADEPLGGWAAMVGRPYVWRAWDGLLDAVRTGENAFERLHGVDAWTYRTRDPAEGAIFDRAMSDLTRRTFRATAAAFDFSRFGTVVDVGGGNGALLVGLLREHPGMRGVLLDLPASAAAAERAIAAAGLEDRCDAIAGSFFDSVPEGGDAYVLRAILHDWGDEEAAAILRSVRRAARDGATLVVIERDLGPPNAVPDAKLSDLNMFVVPGGRERTVDEYGALFAASGFRLVESRPAGFAMHVIVGTPA
jgi:O-methyltransferase/methyltransferase family protein